MFTKILKKFLHIGNVPKHLCNQVVGEKHSTLHRLVAGSLMCALGVFMSKAFAEVHAFYIHYIMDGVGYLVHGLGAIPFAEFFAKLGEDVDE